MAEREALEPALRPARSAEPASRLAVSRAVVALLRRAAARNPLLIAVDDVQWLDPPTAEVLEFAFRRLSERRCTCSSHGGRTGRRRCRWRSTGCGCRRGVAHLRMGPLTPDEVGSVLRDQLRLVSPGRDSSSCTAPPAAIPSTPSRSAERCSTSVPSTTACLSPCRTASPCFDAGSRRSRRRPAGRRCLLPRRSTRR